MKVVAIIPARMAATRFPNKPLAMILGIPMIEHVRRRVALCEYLDDVIVATCDKEIVDVVEKHGGKAVMTADTYDRCTDRIAEVAESVEADIIVNVQGDEPLIMPDMVMEVAKPLIEEENLSCANMVSLIFDEQEFLDPNAPKVVTDCKNNILYISREPIPSSKKAHENNYKKLKQLGLIAFRREFLLKFSKLEPTQLEKIESVDMMRAIEHGYLIRAVENTNKMIGVDVPNDIVRVEEILRNDPLFKLYSKD